MPDMTFGALLRALRIRKELTLREYCKLLAKDVGNVSKLERGILPPPKDEQVVKEYGRALGYDDESPEIQELISLAAIGTGQIPQGVLNDEQLLAKLPIFFRTATGSKLDRDRINAFLDSLRRA